MLTYSLAVDWMINGTVDFHHDWSTVALWRNQSRPSILTQPKFFLLMAREMKVLKSEYGMRSALISSSVLKAHRMNVKPHPESQLFVVPRAPTNFLPGADPDHCWLCSRASQCRNLQPSLSYWVLCRPLLLVIQDANILLTWAKQTKAFPNNF